MEIKEIRFRDLEKFNDSNSIVVTALTLDHSDPEEAFKQSQQFFDEIKLCPGKKVINIYFINDNVLGNNGRPDYLFEFDHPEIQFSPMVRLQYGRDIKWTSDFLDNFGSDYKS